jgi:hypothetical protein
MGYYGLAGVEEATLVKRLTVHGLSLQNFLPFYPMAEQAVAALVSPLRDYQAKLQTVADQRIDLDNGVAYNDTRFKGLVYEGSDLKMADLEAKAQWKIELLKQQTV